MIGLVLAVGIARGLFPADAEGAQAPQFPRLLGPRDAEQRAGALRRYGGTAKTEEAVEAGLGWLARHQAESGLWDADAFHERCEPGSSPCTGIGKGQHGEEVPCPFDQAISALAALAFVGRGHLPLEEPDPGREAEHEVEAADRHARVVSRALRALEAPRDRWSLALVTQVLAEVEAQRRDGAFRESLERHVERLLALRQEDGAWGYAAPFRPGSDVPYTALVVQALRAAADCDVPLPDDLRSGVSRYLGSLEIRNGQLGYLLNGRDYGYTPTTTNGHLAAAVRELLDVDRRSPRHQAHLALIRDKLPVWSLKFETVEVPGHGPMRVQVGNLSLYQWWYGTVASFHSGGTSWSAWWPRLRSELVKAQEKRGCARGSFDPEGTYERQTGGRVFATALAVLMLEQPYLHGRR